MDKSIIQELSWTWVGLEVSQKCTNVCATAGVWGLAMDWPPKARMMSTLWPSQGSKGSGEGGGIAEYGVSWRGEGRWAGGWARY